MTEKPQKPDDGLPEIPGDTAPPMEPTPPEDLGSLADMAKKSLAENGIQVGNFRTAEQGPSGSAPIPKDITTEELFGRFAPNADRPVDVKGWYEMLSRLDSIAKTLDNMYNLMMLTQQRGGE